MNRKQLIEKIIAEEWRQFDLVQNKGGRASCQDDWETFRIMRYAQFALWNDELLESYLKDLLDAAVAGWNLITEKYARMMESTAPSEYEQLKERLPYRSKERLDRQEKVIAKQVEMNESFCKEYPGYAARGRRIHTEDDTPYVTSAETYLRGELTTYSDRTYELYEKWMADLVVEGKNVAKMNADIIAAEYGYTSLEEVEKKYNR